MQIGTGIKLKGVKFNNPALPKLVNYKDVIASHPACVGAWRFDVDELITEDAGGVTWVDSWKEGGGALVPHNSSLITRVVAPDIKSTVAQFVGGERYNLEGQIFDPRNPYTIVAVVKPANYSSQDHIAGAYGVSAGENARIAALQLANGTPAIRHFRGGNAVHEDVTAGQFLAIFASGAGGGDILPSLELLGSDPKKSTGTGEEAITSELPFFVGHTHLTFEGEIDFVALFNADLIYEQAELKAYVDEYLALRMRA